MLSFIALDYVKYLIYLFLFKAWIWKQTNLTENITKSCNMVLENINKHDQNSYIG